MKYALCLSLFFLLNRPATVWGADSIKRVSTCAALVSTKRIGFSKIFENLLPKEEHLRAVNKVFGDWIQFGSVLGGLSVNLLTLQVKDFEGFSQVREADPLQQRVRIGDRKFIRVANSPSGRFSVVANMMDFNSPLLLLENSDSGAHSPHAIRDFKWMDATLDHFRFSPDEKVLAVAKMFGIQIQFVNSGTGIIENSLFIGRDINWFDWSRTEPNTVIVLNADESGLELLRYQLDDSSRHSLLKIDGENYFGRSQALYLPDRHKVVVMTKADDETHFYLLDERTGEGQSVEREFDQKMWGTLSPSPDRRFFLAHDGSRVLIFKTDDLSISGEIPTRVDQGSIIYAAFNSKSQIAVFRAEGAIDLYAIATN